ncbi:MAG: GNAT family N-acetyltransferase [Proteobacteria bacterium]|nr:GNAT family N-acetyltransferase [Pseudomonadota bacterium]
MRDASRVVRPLRAAEVPACAAIVARTPLFASYGLSAASVARQLEAALDDPRSALLVVAAEGEPPLGVAWFVERGAFDRSGYLRLIAVAPERTRGGLGRALVAALEQRYLARGGIVLLAAHGNELAHRFYERLGYGHVGDLPAYVGSGLHERIYFKPQTAVPVAVIAPPCARSREASGLAL